MKILQINASARSAGANSTRLADTITARLLANNPGATVELRDLASQPHPVLDEPALGALFTVVSIARSYVLRRLFESIRVSHQTETRAPPVSR